MQLNAAHDAQRVDVQIRAAAFAEIDVAIVDNYNLGIRGALVDLAGPSASGVSTDAQGNIRFTDLYAGMYTATLRMPAGYTFLRPDLLAKSVVALDGVASRVTWQLIGNGTASGSVIDEYGQGVPGAGIRLDATAVSHGTSFVLTRTDGSWSFSGLPPAGYRVTLAPPQGWSLTGQQGTDIAFTVHAGEHVQIDTWQLREN